MVMIIIHIAYIIWLVTNDAWHTYDVIVWSITYLTDMVGSHILRNRPYYGWLAGTVMCEVGAGNI